MSAPIRIQRRRVKGWRMPENTVSVTRPGRFGNPFRVTQDRSQIICVGAFRTWLTVEGCDARIPEKKKWILDNLSSLRGKNLACYCRVGTVCHADVLLELSNK